MVFNRYPRLEQNKQETVGMRITWKRILKAILSAFTFEREEEILSQAAVLLGEERGYQPPPARRPKWRINTA